MAMVALVTAISLLAFVRPAFADTTNGVVLGGDVACPTQADGTRDCSGISPAFDGVKIDVNVSLPPGAQAGGLPAIGVFHGWGGSKVGFSALHHWTSQGYVAFSMTDRGFGNSCGGPGPPVDQGATCVEHGWIRLMDDRYEVRDAQDFFGRLADEGWIDGQRIGSTGGSYGGGISMALAALKDRRMLTDGTLEPWTSPGGKPMAIAAAAPEIPWTDLAYSLQPNGRTLDYVADAPYLGPNHDAPIGIEKQSFVSGLYALGQASGYYAPPGADQDADLSAWYALINAGEPYDQSPLAADIIDEITTHHSSYYIDHSEPPAPLLISNGWTDDLFPPDEAIRFYNRTRSEYPGNPISLFFLDFGHQRGQNKPADLAVLHAREDAWFAHYLKGEGSAPTGAETLTKTCGSPSAGPYFADSWRELAPGEIRLDSAPSQTVEPVVPSDPQVASTFDPIAAGNDPCGTAPGDDQQGAASYRLPEAPAGGYTLMGSPTVVASISSPSPTDQLAARLEDVAPDGNETLVARALYRPESGGMQVFQLHPDGWKFEEGHIAKLELLPSDEPYGRVSNGQLPITVSNLELRLPVIEQPGALGGLVQSTAPKVLPNGYWLAAGYPAPTGPGATGPGPIAAVGGAKGAKAHSPSARLKGGPLRISGGKLFAQLACSGQKPCGGSLRATTRKGRVLIASGRFSVPAGSSNLVAVPLTRAGRIAARRTDSFKVRVQLQSGGRTRNAVRNVHS